MCRAISEKHPFGLRCLGLHHSAAFRALSVAQLTLTRTLQKHAATRSGAAFGANAQAPVDPDAPLTLSQKVLAALLRAALVVQAQWARVQKHRARVALARKEAHQERTQAEQDKARAAALQLASDSLEAAHDALEKAQAELFRSELLAQDLTPTPGWPSPEIAMEQQWAFASVEADDLAQAVFDLDHKKPLTQRQARELRSLQAKLQGTIKHRDRLAKELKSLPTHGEALASVTRAETGVLEAEASVVQAEDHYDNI